MALIFAVNVVFQDPGTQKMVEIAEKLNMGLNNVKIVLMRARRKLAEIY